MAAACGGAGSIVGREEDVRGMVAGHHRSSVHTGLGHRIADCTAVPECTKARDFLDNVDLLVDKVAYRLGTADTVDRFHHSMTELSLGGSRSSMAAGILDGHNLVLDQIRSCCMAAGSVHTAAEIGHIAVVEDSRKGSPGSCRLYSWSCCCLLDVALEISMQRQMP